MHGLSKCLNNLPKYINCKFTTLLPNFNPMKSILPALVLLLLFLNCQNKSNTSQKPTLEIKTKNIVQPIVKIKSTTADTTSTIKNQNDYALILTSNALQVINKNNGSTSELNFGKSIDDMITITNRILQTEPTSIEINKECGAGALQMAAYNNGLTLIFEQKNTTWSFEGWFLSAKKHNTEVITTMASITIGSTRADLESAYVIEVQKSSLGYEFSTSSGLHGIFDGPKSTSKIINLWSGLSCNFR